MSIEPDDADNVLAQAFQSRISTIANMDIIEKIGDGSANRNAIPPFGPLHNVINDV
jgi:hypothetical protein